MADQTVPQKPSANLSVQQIDKPEIQETFVDSIGAVIFDGQTLRIDGCVTRFGRQTSEGAVAARRYTACRLVLAPAAAVDLMNQLQRVGTELVNAGLLKQAKPPDPAAT